MRKGHIKLLEKAKAANFPSYYINYLEQSELPLKDLEVLYYFYSYRKKNSTIMLDDLQIFDIILNLHLRKNQLYDICYYSSYLNNKTTKKILLQPRKIISLALKIKVGNIISVEEAIRIAWKIKHDNDDYSHALKELLLSSLSFDIRTDAERKVFHDYPISDKKELAKYIVDNTDKCNLIKISKKAIKCGLSFSALIKALNLKDIFQKAFDESPSFEKENVYFVYDPDNALEKLEKIVSTFDLKENLTLDVKNACKVMYSFSELALNITLKKIVSLRYSKKEFYYCETADYKHTEKYVFFFDSMAFFKEIKVKGREKLVRMSVRMMKEGILKYGKPFSELSDLICNHHISIGDYIYKDIKKILMYPFVFIPIYLWELNGKNTIEALCKEKYKKNVPIEWNRGDPSINYLTYKVFFLIKEEDRNILINECRNMRSEEEILNFYNFMKRNNVITLRVQKGDLLFAFVAYILFRRIDKNSFWTDEGGVIVSEKEVFTTFSDYVKMSKALKRKIKLSFRSAKKVRDTHSDIVIDYMIKKDNVPVIKIPKKTVFSKLRKMLPEDEFKWIKTRKGIIEEGYYMRHCVASYAEKVNNDSCAIYSFVYPQTRKRYTIEFLKREERYVVNQIQSKCNRGASQEVKDYINSFLAIESN